MSILSFCYWIWKIYFQKLKNQVGNFAHFVKVVFFGEKKRLPSSFSYFSIWKMYLFRLKSSFSWSAAHVLSNGVKKRERQKNFTWSLNCPHLTKNNSTYTCINNYCYCYSTRISTILSKLQGTRIILTKSLVRCIICMQYTSKKEQPLSCS